jgi:hypothetical protein
MAKRCAAICGLVLALAGCGTPANPPQGATEAPRGQETTRSASPSPTECEDPCTTTTTTTTTTAATARPPAAHPSTSTAVTPTSGRSATVRRNTDGPQSPTYTRDQFGSGWTDPDHNGCDARQDAVARATTNRVYDGKCRIVVADVFDRYTGRTYRQAKTSTFDIDHIVAEHDAWLSGAYTWTRARRIAFANDPADLVLTTASANRSKGDQDPSQWAPASHDGACFYARTYRAIKLRWRLHTTAAQRAAIRHTLATCTGTENRSESVV